MDSWSPESMWCGITHHIIIPKKSFFILFIYFILDHGVTDYIFAMACHDKTTCFEKKLKHFLFWFCQQNVVTHFAMIYMYVNNICTRYVNVHIHQGLNPRPHGSTPRPSPPNHFNFLLTNKKTSKFIVFDMKLFTKFKL
jgi:hypothetical protein